MANGSQRIRSFGASACVFLFAIGFGMHVAGETPAPGAPAAPPKVAESTLGGEAKTISPSEAAAVIQKLTPFAQAPSGAPAQAAEDFGNLKAEKAHTAHTSESSQEIFVPSVVERPKTKKVQRNDPRAVLHTSMGDITIHLFPNYAPKTVSNFIDLARGDREFLDSKTSKPTRRPFYNDLVFHRVISGFLIQTGCPLGTGHGGPGYFISDEITPALRFSKPGIVAMAPERKDSVTEKKHANGSQFFISLTAMPEWDDNFTIFGEVEKGMKVVEKISKVETGPTDRPIRRVYLKSIEIFEDSTPSTATQ